MNCTLVYFFVKFKKTRLYFDCLVCEKTINNAY